LTRRSVLKFGALTTAAALFGKRLGIAAPELPTAPVLPAKAKAVIQIWLSGGPPHLDTFDPKPDAGYDYCGPLNHPIPTNVNGIVISELLPELARQADKYSLIRSMTHGNNGHETAAYLVQAGHDPSDRLVYPTCGAVVSLFTGYDAGYRGLVPPYVMLTNPLAHISEDGFLGPQYKAFATGGDPARTPFAVQGIVAEGISSHHQEERRDFLHTLDTLGNTLKDDAQIQQIRKCEGGAYDMILGDGAKVFDLVQEGNGMREWYGMNSFGQSCLVARRLIEHGVRFVTINSAGWDTHKQNFQTMRQKLPQLDTGLAALLQDLATRGLLDSTIVWCTGEFGRAPKIDWGEPWNGGRGHCGKVFSALVAGGGFRGGQIVGASDAKGEEVKDRPVYPWDLTGTIYGLMGINPEGTFPRFGDGNVRITQAATGDIKSGGFLKEIV